MNNANSIAGMEFGSREKVYLWRDSLAWWQKLLLAFGVACLTGLFAQVRIPLPFTPVPITAQVLAVLLSGVMLGGGYAVLSQFLYLAIGAAGICWFAGVAGGWSAIFGPTGGYLLGFMPAALLVGYATEHWASARRFGPLCLVMLAAVGIIYLLGAIQFSVFMKTGLLPTLTGAVLPFILFDAGKAVAAAAAGAAILPKKDRKRAG